MMIHVATGFCPLLAGSRRRSCLFWQLASSVLSVPVLNELSSRALSGRRTDKKSPSLSNAPDQAHHLSAGNDFSHLITSPLKI